MNPFFGAPGLTFRGLGTSCIAGEISYAADSLFTYCHIVEWIKRLCRGDGDTILITLLFFSIVFGYD